MESLKNKHLDLFLDNWMPSNAANVQPYLDEKSIEAAGAQPDRRGLWPGGAGLCGRGRREGRQGSRPQRRQVRQASSTASSRAMTATRSSRPRSTIRTPACKAGSSSNSSEQGMLAQAQKAMAKKEWIVFLGWAPHPVMGKMNMVYLTGFEKDGFGDCPDQCADPRRLQRRMPECRQAAGQSEVHPADGIRRSWTEIGEQGRGWRHAPRPTG